MDNLYDPGHVCTCGAVIHSGGLNHEHDHAHHLHAEGTGEQTGPGDVIKEKVREVSEKVAPIIRDKVELARAKGNEAALRARLATEETTLKVRQQSRLAATRARGFMREHPQMIAGVSAGVGLLLGMVVRRAMRRNRPLGVLVIETKPQGSHEAVIPAL